MVTIKEALTFDDVLLLPRYSSVLPSKTNIDLNLKYLKFNCSNVAFLKRITLEYITTATIMLNTVARAAPRTPMSNPNMRIGSRMILMMVLVI